MTPDLDRLETVLRRPELGDRAMLLSEFDGFAAGLQVCPESVPQRRWLATAWGGEGVSTPEQDAELKAHVDGVGAALDAPGGYAPLIDRDFDGSFLWEIWASGFSAAMAASPEAWSRFGGAREAAIRDAHRFFGTLAEIAARPGGARSEHERHLSEAAHELIGPELETLRKARAVERDRLKATSSEPPEPKQTAQGAPRRPGRNDACPCGSGKKYKKCCLRRSAA